MFRLLTFLFPKLRVRLRVVNIPFLPPELIDLILTEVRLSCGDDDDARRSNGLAAALVCKAWQPYGVAAIWHTVKLDSPEEMSRLVESAKTFPHFPPFIKELYLLSTPADVNESAQVDGELNRGTDQLADLCALCTHLRVLDTGIASWVTSEQLALALPHLPCLTHLELGAMERSCPSPLRLFPRLATPAGLVKLAITVIVGRENWAGPPPFATPLRVRYLDALVRPLFETEEAGTAPFYLALFDHLDATSPVDVSLTLKPMDLPVIEGLSRFSNLRVLTTLLPSTSASLALVDRVFHLAKTHSNPLIMNVIGRSNPPFGNGHPTELRLPTLGTSSFSAFLAALASSISSFHIRGFYLTLDRDFQRLPCLRDTAGGEDPTASSYAFLKIDAAPASTSESEAHTLIGGGVLVRSEQGEGTVHCTCWRTREGWVLHMVGEKA
ncbi:hypothetical protein JCM10207_007821 [Rhodosporidiobolus poonsookiae]